MLSLKKINKSFKKKQILTNFSFEFNANKIYKLSGPNGSGKTTLLKIIKNIVIPDSGKILINENCANCNNISYIDSNSRSFLHRLSLIQNLEYFSALEKKSLNTHKILEILKSLDLDDILHMKFSQLSAGQAQIISFIRGIVTNPEIILLDESLTNVDKNRIAVICRYLENFASQNNNLIIYCCHNEMPFSKIEDEIVLM